MLIKCSKCASEWKTNGDQPASQTVCSFCQEQITNLKTSGWQLFDNTEDLLVYT